MEPPLLGADTVAVPSSQSGTTKAAVAARNPLREALPALPGVLSATIVAAEERNESLSRALARVPALHVIGAGPCFATAYVFAVCVLMVMQHIHAQPVAGAEFFHAHSR